MTTDPPGGTEADCGPPPLDVKASERMGVPGWDA